QRQKHHALTLWVQLGETLWSLLSGKLRTRESLARKLLEHRIRAIGRRIRCNSSHSFYPSTSLDVRPGLEPRVTSVTPSYAASCMLGLGTKLVNEASVARPTRHQAVQETRGISGPSWSAWVATWQGL